MAKTTVLAYFKKVYNLIDISILLHLLNLWTTYQLSVQTKIWESFLTLLSLSLSTYPLLQALVTIAFAISAVSDTPLTSPPPPQSLPLLFIRDKIIVIHPFIHFPSPISNAFNKFKMHLRAASPALLSTHISILHASHFTATRSNNAYNTKSFLSLTISSISLNHLICLILSISNLLVKLAPPTASVSAFHPYVQAKIL